MSQDELSGLDAVRLMLPLLTYKDEQIGRQVSDLLFKLYGHEIIGLLQRLAIYSDNAMGELAQQSLKRIKIWQNLKIYDLLPRKLHIECMGRFRVSIGDKELSQKDWSDQGLGHGGGIKAQALLAYLVHCGSEGASDQEVMQAVWGESTCTHNRLNSTRSHLCDILDGSDRAWGKSAYIERRQQRLYLRSGTYSTDADEFRRSWQLTYDSAMAGELAEYLAVLRCYTGRYMEQAPKATPWHQDEADHLQSMYLFAVDCQVVNLLAQGDYHLSRDLCEQGLRLDPSDSTLMEHMLRIVLELNREPEASCWLVRYLEATQLTPQNPEYAVDPVVHLYWNLWPANRRQDQD